MTSKTFLSASRGSILLGLLFFVMALSHSSPCPDTCYCIDSFVTCSDFTFLDLATLPTATDTLILSRGELDEIPSGFLAKATNLRMLEMNDIKAKVIRRGAFSDLNNLDLFSITSSTFDIVESESFSRLTEVSKFHISESKLGRIDKHAFANVSLVGDFRIWSSTFGVIADEAFYKLSDIIAFQLYQNNITSLGSKLFVESSGIDDITIYRNKIQKVSDECFTNIKDVTSRLVLHANVFVCSCDLVWILGNPVFIEYLESNQCIFPDHTGQEISIFRIADVTREALCPGISSEDFTESTTSATAGTTYTSDTRDVFVSTEDWEDSTSDLVMSTFSPRFRSSLSSASVTSMVLSESTELPKEIPSTTSDLDEPSSSQSPIKSSTTEMLQRSSSPDFLIIFSTDTHLSDDTDNPNPNHLTSTYQTPTQTKDYLVNNRNTPDFLREVTPEGWTEPNVQPSIDVDNSKHAQLYSTSAIDMTTSVSNTASNISQGSLLFIAVLSGLSLLLITTP